MRARALACNALMLSCCGCDLIMLACLLGKRPAQGCDATHTRFDDLDFSAPVSAPVTTTRLAGSSHSMAKYLPPKDHKTALRFLPKKVQRSLNAVKEESEDSD